MMDFAKAGFFFGDVLIIMEHNKIGEPHIAKSSRRRKKEQDKEAKLIEKTEKPETPTRIAKVNERKAKYKFSLLVGDSTNCKILRLAKIIKVPITNHAIPFCKI